MFIKIFKWLMFKVKLNLKSVATYLIGSIIDDQIYKRHFVYGDQSRLSIGNGVNLNNALINTASGRVVIGDYSFCGHNVSLITGTHDYNLTGKDRQTRIPANGRDIVIGKGVWIGSNAVILGPCEIGDNAVIGACSLVNKNVDKDSIYHGIPAKKSTAKF